MLLSVVLDGFGWKGRKEEKGRKREEMWSGKQYP